MGHPALNQPKRRYILLCFRTKVLLGVTDFGSIRDSTKSVFVITERKIHPGYRKPAAYHDLAIAKLNRAIPQSFHEV